MLTVAISEYYTMTMLDRVQSERHCGITIYLCRSILFSNISGCMDCSLGDVRQLLVLHVSKLLSHVYSRRMQVKLEYANLCHLSASMYYRRCLDA